MRYIFLILAVFGLGYLINTYMPSLTTKVAFTMAGVGISWSICLIVGMALIGVAKLKFGK